MRIALVLVMLSGCSVLEMKPLAPDYDPRTIPRCEAEGVYAFGDALGAAGFVGLGIYGAIEGNEEYRTEGMVLSGLVAAILTASAVGGFLWADECDKAKKQWDVRQIEQDTLVRRASRDPRDSEAEDLKRIDAREKTQAELRRQQAMLSSTPAVSTPRGFYCSISATAGFCMREKADCETARGAVLVSVDGDHMSECALTEKAFCFQDKRCAPTSAMCDAQAKRVGTGAQCLEAR